MVDADAFNEFEVRGWEAKASGYDDFFAPVTGRAVDPLLDAAGVGSGTRLLDLGSGPGYVAARAAERDAIPVGVDVAESMIALARGRHPGIEFRRGAAEDLPFEDASFDACVANFAIPHLGRPERAVAELVRVLRPGGGLALTTWDQPQRARLVGVFVDAAAAGGEAGRSTAPAGPDFFGFSDEDAFAALLRDCGLEHVSVGRLEFSHAVSGPEELWEGMLGATVRTSALITSQSPDAQRRIRAEFERLIEPHRAEDGSLQMPVSIKLARGDRPR